MAVIIAINNLKIIDILLATLFYYCNPIKNILSINMIHSL